mgnify:CR=1 FL=1
MAKGSIKEVRPGVFVITYDAEKGIDGKRNQRRVTIHGALEDAENRLRDIQYEKDHGFLADPGKLTVEGFLKQWYELYCEPTLSKTTLDTYNIIIEKHIKPAMGKTLLKKLTAMDLQRYYKKKMETHSAQTVLHHHRLLHKALDMALKWGLVFRNIADAVIAPRPVKYEADVYDIQTVIDLLALFKDTRLYIPVLLACACGLRRGEVLALRWKDYDAKRKRITINSGIVVSNKEIIVKQPKTKKSRRTITLPESIVAELAKHKARQNEEILAAEEGYWINKDLISPWHTGDYFHPGTFSDYYGKILESSDLPYIRFHDLRHTHASLLVYLGVQPKAISDRLGHSGIGITMDTYSHLLPGSGESIAQLLDEKVFNRAK